MARSISAWAAAMLAALSLIEFIWMSETFMGRGAPGMLANVVGALTARQPRRKAAKALSWSAMKPRVAGSVSSPVAASIFVLT